MIPQSIFAIDPGTTESAFLIWNGATIEHMGYFTNQELLELLNTVAFVRGSRLLYRPSKENQAAAEKILRRQQGAVRGKEQTMEKEEQSLAGCLPETNSKAAGACDYTVEVKEQKKVGKGNAGIPKTQSADVSEIRAETSQAGVVQKLVQKVPQNLANKECTQTTAVLSTTKGKDGELVGEVDGGADSAPTNKAGGNLLLLRNQKTWEQRAGPSGPSSATDSRRQEPFPKHRHSVHLMQSSERNDASGQIHLAVEGFQSFGMSVGQEVFKTCIWIGRFLEAWNGESSIVYRLEVKRHLCHDTRAKDGNIRQALIDRFGPPGVKSKKGVLYGVSKHLWSALAVATFAFDNLKAE